jgi:hypothetical protein
MFMPTVPYRLLHGSCLATEENTGQQNTDVHFFVNRTLPAIHYRKILHQQNMCRYLPALIAIQEANGFPAYLRLINRYDF